MKYQVYKLAATLSSVEWNQFTREVRQGMLTRHAPTQALVNGLKPLHPGFKVEDGALYAKAFPGEKFDDARLRVLRAGIKELLESFLIQKALEKRKGIRSILLTGELIRRGYLDEARRVIDSSTAAPAETVEDGLRNFELQEYGLELDIRENQRNRQHDWSRILDSLALYSNAQMLRLLCAIFNESNLLSQDTQEFQRRAAQAIQAAAQAADSPALISIYARLLGLLSGRETESLTEPVRNWLQHHQKAGFENERLNVLGLWINHLIQGDLSGKSGYLRQTFEAYAILLETDHLFHAGSFSVHSARNAVAVASRLGETGWGRAFLKRAQEELNAADLPGLSSYANAYLDFSEGNTRGALRHLRNTPVDDPFYRLATDLLLLRIWFETHEDDSFLSLHAALTRQMYRKEKVASNFRKSIQSFLSVISKLHDLRSQSPSARSRGLENVNSYRASLQWMTLREWIEKQVQKLASSV